MVPLSSHDSTCSDVNAHLPQAPTEGSTYGGSLLRLEYEELERRQSPTDSSARSAKRLENIIVGIGFGAVAILVTMVLVAVGTAI